MRRKSLNSEGDRASQPVRAELPTDADQIALLEARNGLRQVDAIRAFIQKSVNDSRFKLRPSDILGLNRVAIEGINRLAGVFRPDEMKISASRHNPPPPDLVPRMVEDMCDYVDQNSGKPPIHLAAYLLWRINWIHPFDDGNGRTARATAYAVLCILLGYELPGTHTIPEQIAENKQPYYKALEAADEAYSHGGRIDVGVLERLLEEALAKQLLEVHERATGKELEDDQAV